MLEVWREQLSLAHRRHNHMDAVRLGMLKLIMAVHAGLLLAVVLRVEPLPWRVALIVQFGVAVVTMTLFTVQVKRSVYAHRCKVWIKSLERQLLRLASGAPALDGLHGSYYWDENVENRRMGLFSVAFTIPFVNALVPMLACVALGGPAKPAAAIAVLSLVMQLTVGWSVYNAAGSSPYRKAGELDPFASPSESS